MKFEVLHRLLAFFGAFILLSSLYAQTDVYLKINHKWNGNTFIGKPTVSQSGSSAFFILTRMEYYMSGFEIIHDSGMVTPIPGKYLLVNADDTSFEFLGSFNLSNIEGISFHIGVDSAANHSDPSLYEGNHPLKLKFPSMHWGWASGYRFIAFEAGTGVNMNEMASIHTLGNKNYHKQTQTVSANQFGSDLIINLDAEYANGFNSITIDPNLFYHGDLEDAKTLIENFRDYVFSGSTVGITASKMKQPSFSIYPNPTSGIIGVSTPDIPSLFYEVRGLSGKLINKGFVQNGQQLDLRDYESGIYLIQFFDEQGFIKSEKVVLH